MTKLIAEIGINHLGDENRLFSMISTLAESKIDSCKLQYRGEQDFFDKSLEMGSTLISDELNSVNLSLSTTVKAVEFAQSLDIEIGVSFFRMQDAKDLTQLILPDYFKVPSAEALNFELIEFLQGFQRPVYVSTGGLEYPQLKALSEAIKFNNDDCVMYCVANYPAALGTSVPAYIDAYRKLFRCKVGYSSHDVYWEMNIAFLDRNVDVIERHYTDDKDHKGLDISTSSDLFELMKLQRFCSNNVWSSHGDLMSKIPNQGELQNLKDLGSGYYFTSNYPKGSEVKVSDLKIKSPCRGLKAGSLKDTVTLLRDAEKGEPLSQSHLKAGANINSSVKLRSDELELSLPVRLHDYEKINNMFAIQNYEWHLSYAEVEYASEYIAENFKGTLSEKKFSIHLPDYISPNDLIDPNSPNEEIKNSSTAIISKVEALAVELQQYTGSLVPIVGSFSVIRASKEDFYGSLAELISNTYEKNNVKIFPQFLPKMAWYFGGSVELDVFCDIADINYFRCLPFGICLDTAHCIMAANFHEANHTDWIKELLPLSSHIHLSDAEGVDGEGVPFGKGEIESELNLLLASRPRKVVEQWEGHLDEFNGFKKALIYLTEKHRCDR